MHRIAKGGHHEKMAARLKDGLHTSYNGQGGDDGEKKLNQSLWAFDSFSGVGNGVES
jgi:hypothetical protein